MSEFSTLSKTVWLHTKNQPTKNSLELPASVNDHFDSQYFWYGHNGVCYLLTLSRFHSQNGEKQLFPKMSNSEVQK